nr:hypothetical protein [Tanacetum cinerariifolium]
FQDCSKNNSNEVPTTSTIVPTVWQNTLNSTNTFSAAGLSNTAVSPTYGDASQFPNDPNFPRLEDIIYSDNEDVVGLEDIIYSDDEDVVGVEADFNNLESFIPDSPIPTIRIHKDHPVSQIIGDLSLTTQTRSMTRSVKDQGGLSQMFGNDFYTCMFDCFLSQEEPKREEGINYDEVFAPVAMIEAIRLFLAYASFMGFMVHQMDVKSAFLYGTIEEEVYVCQPLGFEDPDHPDKVKQKKDGIFISQDKYVAEILRKFGLTKGKSASTPIDTEKPLLKDLNGKDVDVHTYRSMIGSLMYLTSSRPDIMFAWKKQTVVATSSIEAEYVVAASCCVQVVLGGMSAAGLSNTAVSPTYGDASQFPNDPNFPRLEDIIYSDNEDVVGPEADFNNLEPSIPVSPILTTSIHKDHPISQIIGDLSSTTQRRSMTRPVKDKGGVSQMFGNDFHTYMFACFLSQEEPKRVHQTLKDPSWIKAMQEELLQFKMQKVWVLVDLPYGKLAIVARIKAIRLFLAYASFMGFMVYQMDVKSAFLYGTIEEEVYVCQPLGFEDPDHPHKVKQKEDGIFISQDKYVAKILRKFRLTEGKSTSTLIDTKKPLLKDPGGEDVDVLIYRSMIGSLMYLTSSRPDIMFACKKQTVVAPSSTEAEYVAAASGCAQVPWIQNQLLDYGYNFMHTWSEVKMGESRADSGGRKGGYKVNSKSFKRGEEVLLQF